MVLISTHPQTKRISHGFNFHTPPKNVFHMVLIFTHLKEKYNLIKRDNDEVNEEEGEEYVLTFAHPS